MSVEVLTIGGGEERHKTEITFVGDGSSSYIINGLDWVKSTSRISVYISTSYYSGADEGTYYIKYGVAYNDSGEDRFGVAAVIDQNGNATVGFLNVTNGDGFLQITLDKIEEQNLVFKNDKNYTVSIMG